MLACLYENTVHKSQSNIKAQSIFITFVTALAFPSFTNVFVPPSAQHTRAPSAISANRFFAKFFQIPKVDEPEFMPYIPMEIPPLKLLYANLPQESQIRCNVNKSYVGSHHKGQVNLQKSRRYCQIFLCVRTTKRQ